MTYRSLALYSPDFNPDNEPKFESGAPPPIWQPIRFKHIALLVFGGIIVGSIFGVIASVAIYAFTHSKFLLSAIFGTCVYGSWIVGYQQLAQKHQWTALRTRFAPVGKKVLLVSALAGVGIVGLIAAAAELLEWAGVKIDHIPTPDILPHTLLELPLAVFVIVVVGPLCEELLFRGLLLDWLKQKINIWIAALILSVIFSLLHANPFSLGAIGWLAFSHRFLLGLTASALTIRYQSLRPSLVMHGTMNAIACITAMLGFA
jgi:membrane protease YdiL (CAAX protease family)